MKVIKRTLLGKKFRNLKKAGLMAAVIYDKDTNIAVQIPVSDFQKEYLASGHTGVIKVTLDSDKYNVMIDNVQIDPVTRKPIHATLREVNLKEEINATVPLVYANLENCKGVKEDGGIIVTNIDEVEVIALPTHIPSSLSVDVEELRLEGEGIKLEDIKLPEGVRFATEDENVLSQIVVLVTHKAVEEPIEAGPTETVVAESTKEKKKEEVVLPDAKSK